MRIFFVYLVLFFLLPDVTSSLAQDTTVQQISCFFSSRKIASIVYFKEGSSELSEGARRSLNSIAPQLHLLNPDKVLVRIEGFAGSEEGGKHIPLSMERALAVMSYLGNSSSLDTTSFFIGCGDRQLDEVPPAKRHRVEIALYDNVLPVDAAHVDKIILNWQTEH